MNVTVAICTQNHRESLRQTLATLARAHVPEGLDCELLVVDNASTDGTAEMVRSHAPVPRMTLRYASEPRRGAAHARNTAVAEARGEIVLFIDDDVRPYPDWLEKICAPIVEGRAHAVVGGVKLAPHLERPWMTPRHRAWMASTETLDAEDPPAIISANAALSKEVFRRVPCFDTELGPGRLGFWEDSLFSFQLKEAGYRIAAAFDAVAEHHFDESRLSRSSFLDRARKEGRSWAYVAHHWEHREVAAPRRLMTKSALYLAKRRALERPGRHHPEGLPEWEMDAVVQIYFQRQYLAERARPRNYERRGLVKLGGGETCPAA
jgi:glycosyltransferase involved in cell wall biosynthesis